MSSLITRESTPAALRAVPSLISPGSGVLPGRSAFSVSRHVRHGEARGERPGLAMLPPVGEESRSVTTPRSLMSTLFPQSRGPRADGQVQPRAPGSVAAPGGRAVPGRPGRAVVAVTVSALTRRTVRAGPCPPLAGSPPPPGHGIHGAGLTSCRAGVACHTRRRRWWARLG